MRLVVRKIRCLPSCIALATLAGLMPQVQAQTAPVNAAGADAKADAKQDAKQAAEERAQKQAERVFTWIRFQGEAAANKKQNAAAPAAAPAPAKPSVAKAPAASTNSAAAPAAATAGRAPSSDAALAAAAATAAVAAPNATPPAAAAAVLAASAEPAPAAERKDAAVLALAAPAVTKPAAPPVVEEEPQLTLIHRVEPEVPRRYLKDFAGGSVLLSFMVQTDGSVQQAKAVRSTNSRATQLAIDAISKWRFQPISRPREGRVEVGFGAPE